jgi:MFS family permease
MSLRVGIRGGGWTITIYALGQVIAMPMAGRLSDMFGRKKVFLLATAVFTVSSLCAGFGLPMAAGFVALSGGW